jgi:ABC-2 type transport system ATP-binding protein
VTATGAAPSRPADRRPAIEVDGLRKRYGRRDVLAGVSFRVDAGEVVALLGPNGAGKTTTVEIVEGYRTPDGGRVTVLGADPSRAGRDHRARVGLMLQGGGGVDPRMTPREALELYGRFHRGARDAPELLRLVGLEHVAATRFRRLSGGERQRLGVALALVGRPEVVVLDEPTAGLDVEARAAMRGVVAALKRDGIAVLLTSHDLDEVERVADRIAILDRGRIVAEGRPGELAGGAHRELRFTLSRALDAAGTAALEERLARRVAEEERGRYRLDGEPSPAIVAELAAWAAENDLLIADLRVGGATLEERYLDIVAAAEGRPDEAPP